VSHPAHEHALLGGTVGSVVDCGAWGQCTYVIITIFDLLTFWGIFFKIFL
jgi:hypothetical protein